MWRTCSFRFWNGIRSLTSSTPSSSIGSPLNGSPIHFTTEIGSTVPNCLSRRFALRKHSPPRRVTCGLRSLGWKRRTSRSSTLSMPLFIKWVRGCWITSTSPSGSTQSSGASPPSMNSKESRWFSYRPKPTTTSSISSNWKPHPSSITSSSGSSATRST